MSLQRNERREEVPLEACRFAASFTTGKGDGKNVPFSSLARTAEPVPHWYWGKRCLHDFAGMDAADVLPVDYQHDDEEALGLVNARKVDETGLTLSGELVPFQPDDRCSEVIHKSAAGIPYQASIDFDPFDLVVEDIPEGFSTQVNGKTWQGPLTVFRNWKLNGMAVCLHGIDDGTNVRFSRKLSGATAAVTRFSKGPPMDGQPATPPATDTPPATPATPAPGAAPGAAPGTPTDKPADKPTDKPAETPPATPAPTETPPDNSGKMSRAQQFAQFQKEFSEAHAATLFSKHDRIEDARVEYCQLLTTENSKLKEDLGKFARPNQGNAPASFSGSGTPAAATKFSHLGPNLSKLAGALVMPTRKTS